MITNINEVVKDFNTCILQTAKETLLKDSSSDIFHAVLVQQHIPGVSGRYEQSETDWRVSTFARE